MNINKYKSENETINIFQCTDKIKIWENEKCLNFQNNLNLDKIEK